jgi:Tfp pilus assembly protein PilN
MRPINLIPPEERRGEQAPLRSGPLAYVLVGALVLLLLGVVGLVTTGNQISEREEEVATLKREDAAEAAKAQRLAAYTQFRTLSEQRVQTVQSLADSRFDWERVMRELALVLPADAWLTELTANAGGGSEGGEGGGSLGALGPTLELSGCTTGQEATAGFVTALKDIDGVTRVGVQSSELPEQSEAGGGGGGGGEAGGGECQTRNFIAKFEIVVAFDAAPVPAAEGEAEAAPEAAPEAAQVAQSESSESSSETSSASSESEGG